MKKEVLIFVFLITLTSSVYSLQCLTGTTPTSSNSVSDMTCGPATFVENCIDPDTNNLACETFVCMDDAFNTIAGQIGATFLPPLCQITSPNPPYDYATACEATASKAYQFLSGVLSGETYPHGGYTNPNPHDSLQRGCCGDDSTGSNSIERQFQASSPGDGYGSRCCATPPGDSPEVVYRGYCCGIGPYEFGQPGNSNIVYVDADTNANACNGIEDNSHGIYMCQPSGEVIVNLQTSKQGSPGMTCGSGLESCYLTDPSRFGPGTFGNCCGDDNNEGNAACRLDSGLTDGSSCPPNDYTCQSWPNYAVCVYQGSNYQRYNSGTCTSGAAGGTCHDLSDPSSDLEICMGTASIDDQMRWIDPDQANFACSEVGGTWISNSNYCQNDPSGRWGNPTDQDCDDAGLDVSFSGFCCGDDNNEFVNNNGGLSTPKCCASAGANYANCNFIPPVPTLYVNINAPSPGNVNQQLVTVNYDFTLVSSSNPSSAQVNCAVTTTNNPPAYSGSNTAVWTQTQSFTQGENTGTNNLNLNLVFENRYNITMACFDSYDGLLGQDTVQIFVTRCGNDFLDAGELCDVVSGNPEFSGLGSDQCSDYNSIYTSGTLSCTSTCQIDTSACTSSSIVCGDGVVEGLEGCELPGTSYFDSNFTRSSDIGLCPDTTLGIPLSGCDLSCNCKYAGPNSDSYSIRYSGICDGVDKLGIGTATDTLVTFLPDGTNYTSELPERNCIGLEVNEPFIGPISILIALTILVSFYLFRKKLSN